VAVVPQVADAPPPFPPRPDFSSLSLRDLIETREAYHVHLSHLPNVVGTGIGRYLIDAHDWLAHNPPDVERPASAPRPAEPRTLRNSIVRSWSWPCVLVFVRDWVRSAALAPDAIPKRLYLPDGRQVPTCVVLAPPDEALPPPVDLATAVQFSSDLLGGGYRCERDAQGTVALGTLGCLVRREGTYFALTNKHVTGGAGEAVYVRLRGEAVRVGVAEGASLAKKPLSELFPGFATSHTLVNMDAGLVRIDDVSRWTSQVFGIGEVGEVFDATTSTLTLDLIGLPVRAFGGVSGVIEGEIKALFFRYQSQGDYDYVSDVLIGPRTAPASSAPLTAGTPRAETHPGDSGTVWFYDPPSRPRPPGRGKGPQPVRLDPPPRGSRARRLRPIAMQWGGQRVLLPDGERHAFALGTFLSTICRTLDVEIDRGWSTGHDEYWGKIGHFAVGWKACGLVTGPLGTLMKANQARIGFDNADLGRGSEFRMGRDGFVPLADVPDYVWVGASQHVPARKAEPGQHFADIDVAAIDGGPSLLQACRADARKVDPAVWRDYFKGFADAGCGPEEGALPFRVWQLFDLMVESLGKKKDVKRFVAAAGVLAHYVGDASQPLHSSYLHHGRLPMVAVGPREYPVAHDSPAYRAYAASPPAKVHGLYEERMLEIDAPSALAAIDEGLAGVGVPADVGSGWRAACATFALMSDAHDRLPPETIVDADDPSLGDRRRAERLWARPKIRAETVASLAASTVLLARLWASAWRLGNGKAIAASKLRAFPEAEIEALYRSATFAPALTLDEMARSGDFVVP
jgi:hypothetical protein